MTLPRDAVRRPLARRVGVGASPEFSSTDYGLYASSCQANGGTWSATPQDDGSWTNATCTAAPGTAAGGNLTLACVENGAVLSTVGQNVVCLYGTFDAPGVTPYAAAKATCAAKGTAWGWNYQTNECVPFGPAQALTPTTTDCLAAASQSCVAAGGVWTSATNVCTPAGILPPYQVTQNTLTNTCTTAPPISVPAAPTPATGGVTGNAALCPAFYQATCINAHPPGVWNSTTNTCTPTNGTAGYTVLPTLSAAGTCQTVPTTGGSAVGATLASCYAAGLGFSASTATCVTCPSGQVAQADGSCAAATTTSTTGDVVLGVGLVAALGAGFYAWKTGLFR